MSTEALRIEELTKCMSQAEIEKTKEALDGSATAEVLLMATAFRVLAEDTHQHADDERADGFTLTAEDTDARADLYRESYDALLKIWNR